MLAAELGNTDIGDADLDKPPPLDRIPVIDQGARATVQNLRDVVVRENPTVRQLYQRFSGARGSCQLSERRSGSPTRWSIGSRPRLRTDFIVQPSFLPGGLDDFVELVVPELQHRGIDRRDYGGKMLRDHLGLRRPPSRYEAAASRARGS